MDALSKGLNFAPTLRKISVESMITNVADTIARNKKNCHEAECLRQDVLQVLRKSKLPKPNIVRSELNTLDALRRNSDVLVLPAHKSNATVIVDTRDYEEKMNNLLCDSGTYKRSYTSNQPTKHQLM
ncbi:uncharacterized protein LOC113228610 [Hyposmocoma kahamanoa]|uniref:uncharacterized protein LOC113228610 n=1 Tax=Hyposmocoma kahamanoa TaxID=1477025 RepID=UPI000E6D819B|nr:uncharacterized protein LOC113228610 [Hyposmocoma kahamanoa]